MNATDTARRADLRQVTLERDSAAGNILVDKPSWSTERREPKPAAGGDAHRERLRSRRRRIGVAAAALVGMVLLDPMVGSLQHQQRQAHLAVAFEQPKVNIGAGDALAVLQIPSLDVSEIVSEGSDANRLRSGPGHVIGTSLPGAKGNTVILGHASRYGGPLGEIGTLTEGARIALKSRSGFVQLYKVTTTKKVSADDVSALKATKDEQLTLVTSEDGWLPGKRVVVTAEPDVEAAAPPAVAVRVPKYVPAPGSLDDVPFDLRALALAALLTTLVLFGVHWLSGRYRRGTVVVVAVPAIALVAVSILHLADVIGPATW